ncbi:lytic transglycosylase domain-containing protein [Geomonas anaerohicana]|uniref:Lytic transglycosylase domain-containing protein n=1 Tax=Geomonas anaerohicana TaxID=2798583 RepID=A0ABS0YC99_9BACT|nr:lytic transglycosylase domain-containing protein [Geomonas anaerohicana]MBJ6749918.1 lytic transglycosylase domain-containing protein [Geomonas anaerohicana]
MFLIGITLYASVMLAECGPAVSPETTQAIIQVESGGNPLAIGDNTLKKSFAPKSAADAVQLATRLMREGHNIDMGLMQVNSCHVRPMKLSLEELFDSCRNIRIGTTILAEFYRQHKTDDSAQSLFRALSAYNTGQAWKGTGYINRILQAAGAGYRVSTPAAQFPLQAGAIPPGKPPAKPKTARESAAASPLFFDNLTGAMTAGDL